MKISRRKQPRKGKQMSGNKTLTLGSLFDGSGSFPFGGILAGIEPKWNSEIEPFPVLVTHKRLPQVKHYGDVSGISGADLEPGSTSTSDSRGWTDATTTRRASATW
jgi:site-specific DNA-cytosine methylase